MNVFVLQKPPNYLCDNDKEPICLMVLLKFQLLAWDYFVRFVYSSSSQHQIPINFLQSDLREVCAMQKSHGIYCGFFGVVFQDARTLLKFLVKRKLFRHLLDGKHRCMVGYELVFCMCVFLLEPNLQSYISFCRVDCIASTTFCTIFFRSQDRKKRPFPVFRSFFISAMGTYCIICYSFSLKF